jgi:hypothetical protein
MMHFIGRDWSKIESTGLTKGVYKSKTLYLLVEEDVDGTGYAEVYSEGKKQRGVGISISATGKDSGTALTKLERRVRSFIRGCSVWVIIETTEEGLA